MIRVVRLVAATVLLAVSALLLGCGNPDEPVVASASVPPVAGMPAPAIERQQPPAAVPQQGLGAVTLHGILLRGIGGVDSQVLLKVDGHAEQLYRVGDEVIRGWSVQEIREHDTVLAHGAARTRVAIANPQPASGQSAAAALGDPAAVSRASAPMAGFTAGPPPNLAEAGASERNRRFLEARQGRALAR